MIIQPIDKQKSSNISCVGYDEDKEKAYIWFRSGWIYEYDNISPILMRNWLGKDAHFSFTFNRFFRGFKSKRRARVVQNNSGETPMLTIAYDIIRPMTFLSSDQFIFCDEENDTIIFLDLLEEWSPANIKKPPIRSFYVWYLRTKENPKEKELIDADYINKLIKKFNWKLSKNDHENYFLEAVE